jgi:hypothetical protein
MKFRVVMYGKDDLANHIEAALDEVKPALDDDARDAKWGEVYEFCKQKWFEYGDYLTVEIDTEAQTCTVVPVKKN